MRYKGCTPDVNAWSLKRSRSVEGGKKQERLWKRHATTQLARGRSASWPGNEYNSRSKIADYRGEIARPFARDIVASDASHLSAANDSIAGPELTLTSTRHPNRSPC